ncbi:MAG TPA: YabP/YqfC family sporulation protein [Candidatus Borkfalkia excrementipullorum]|nr:YabP/YqfC family sporulation protein [Candidatus Borkfalkia excrementipullorum]
MRLFEEILSAAGFGDELSGGAKVVLFAGRCGYFENVKSISSFSDTAVSLLLKRGEVHVEGKNLCVARYGEGDLLLKGEIERVEMLGGKP